MAGSLQPSGISYAFTVRARIQNIIEKLAEVLSAIGWVVTWAPWISSGSRLSQESLVKQRAGIA
jgi:hypothetical protein